MYIHLLHQRLGELSALTRSMHLDFLCEIVILVPRPRHIVKYISYNPFKNILYPRKENVL